MMLNNILSSIDRYFYFCGVGKSEKLAELFSASLQSIGVKSFVISALNWSHGDIGQIQNNSTFIFLSDSGETSELLYLANYVNTHFGSEMWYFGQSPGSTLGKKCMNTWTYKVTVKSNNLGLPTFSLSAAVNTFYAEFDKYIKLNTAKSTIAKTHPNGLIGMKNRSIETLPQEMKYCNSLSCSNATVGKILTSMTQSRLGSVVITTDELEIINIVTDGDIRRCGIENTLLEFALERRSVLTAKIDSSLYEVKNLMKSEKVTTLPIIDEQQKYKFSLNIRDLVL